MAQPGARTDYYDVLGVPETATADAWRYEGTDRRQHTDGDCVRVQDPRWRCRHLRLGAGPPLALGWKRLGTHCDRLRQLPRLTERCNVGLGDGGVDWRRERNARHGRNGLTFR